MSVQKSKSSLKISQEICAFLEKIDPENFDNTNRARNIEELNDVLQGKIEGIDFETLIFWLNDEYGADYEKELEEIEKDISEFISNSAQGNT